MKLFLLILISLTVAGFAYTDDSGKDCKKLPARDNIVRGKTLPQGAAKGRRPLGTEYNFTCQPPYVLKPEKSHTIKCVMNTENDKLEWNKKIPRCVCTKNKCSLPNTPKNAQSTKKAEKSCLRKITYMCKTGYKLVGGDLVRECKRNGKWSGDAPKCEELRCPQPKLLQNGKINEFDTTRETGKVRYSCNSRYYLTGDAIHNCSGKGDWVGISPRCIAFCQKQDIEKNRVIVSSKWSLFKDKDKVTLQCQKGYAATPGVYQSTCHKGKWNGKIPNCQPENGCSRPQLPSHAYIKETAEKFAVDESVTYYCQPGFQLQGHPKRQCLSKENWCGFSPTCKLITCPPLRPSENSVLKDLSHTTAKFSCLDGYEMIGASILSCMPSEQWNGNPPRCIQDCGGCKLLTGGKRTLAYRSCSGGIGWQWAALSADTRKNQTFRHCAVTCLKTKSGYGSADPRLLIDMLREYDVTNVKVYGVKKIDEWSSNVLKLSNLPDVRDIRGFEIYVAKFWNPSGRDRIHRQYATQCGHRSDTLKNQSVYEVCCGKPTRGRYLAIHIPGKHRVLSICEVEIFYKSKHCSTERKTSELATVTHCPNPGNISNGQQLGNNGRNFVTGFSVEYTCNSCFELHGDKKITCSGDGTWKYSEFPRCLKKACSRALLNPAPQKRCALEAFPHGSIEPFEPQYKMNESVTFKCEKEYHLNGASELTCLGDCLWSAPWPKCTIKSCSRPLPPLHGQIMPIEDYYLIGSSISYECDYGYKIIGNDKAKCLESQTWNHEPPTCERIQCVRPALPEDVLITPYRDFYPLNFQVSFQCSTDRHGLKGADTAACNADGQWTKSAPICDDPCQDTLCNESEHRKLILSYGKCECVCQDEDDCSEEGEPVCGTDAKTYKSACHLYTHACNTGRNIAIARNGRCKQGGVCTEPKPSGDCSAYEQKWFFNAQRRQCEKFNYGNCFTGNNVFSTQHECYKTCECQPFCAEEKDRGPCRNNDPSNRHYFFSWEDGQCKVLHYGGCFGNQNNFKTDTICRRTCGGQKRNFVLPSQKCQDRHNLTMKDACKIVCGSDNRFLITATIDSRQIGRFGYRKGFIITVGKKYLGPPRVAEENPEYLVNAETVSCACKPLLEREEYLLSGFVNDNNKLAFDERSIVYPFSNFRDLDAEVLLECPDIYD